MRDEMLILGIITLVMILIEPTLQLICVRVSCKKGGLMGRCCSGASRLPPRVSCVIFL